MTQKEISSVFGYKIGASDHLLKRFMATLKSVKFFFDLFEGITKGKNYKGFKARH